MSINLAPNEFQPVVHNVVLLEGKAFFKPSFPSLKPNLTRYRRPPLRPRLRTAAGALFLEPGDSIKPLRPRVKAAWRAIRPARRQTISQRLRWAIRADRSNIGTPGPYGTPLELNSAAIGYWITPSIRRRLYILRARLQRMRWGYHEFR
jgi:hypothetical protein